MSVGLIFLEDESLFYREDGEVVFSSLVVLEKIFSLNLNFNLKSFALIMRLSTKT